MSKQMGLFSSSNKADSKWFSNMPFIWWLKLWSIFLATFLCFIYSFPTFFGDHKDWPKVEGKQLANNEQIEYKHWYHSILANYFPSSKISLGLDLRGGLHLVLEVDADDSLKNSVTRAVDRVRNILSHEGFNINFEIEKNLDLNVNLSGVAKSGQLIVKLFKEEFAKQTKLVQLKSENGNSIVYKANDTEVSFEKEKILIQAMVTVRNRIDQFHVLEPNIYQYGKDRIVVQLPGMKDPEGAKQLIGKTAKLDFRLVKKPLINDRLETIIDEAKKTLNIKEIEINEDIIAKISRWLQDNKKISSDYKIMFENDLNKLKPPTPYIVESNARLVGDEIEDASAGIDQNMNSIVPEVAVSLKFKDKGSVTFGQITGEAVKGKKDDSGLTGQVAIILDGNIISAPNVNEPITGGNARITMGSKSSGGQQQQYKEAQELAMALKSGSLPATVKIIEERQVGPSEGEDNIKFGMWSSIIATLLIIIFMWYVYGNAGIIANFAMLLNILVIFSFLSMLGSTLTLPGIAGITLTLAMAVDGNVVINERIREEVNNGLNPKQAFYKGYDASFFTLVDAHMTTFSAGLILLIFGNPAVKGFAVTLIIGIIATLFTSYYVTEVIGQWLIEKTKLKRFS